MNRTIALLVSVVLLPLPSLRAQELSGPGLPDGALARVGSIQLRHQSAIHQLAFLSDGTLAALDMQGHFRVWDTATGLERRSFAHKSEAVLDSDTEFMQFEMMRRMGGKRMGRRFREEMEFGLNLSNQTFSADGRHLAIAEPDRVTLRDTTTGKVWRQLTLKAPERKERERFERLDREMPFRPAAFSSDGRYFAASTSMASSVIQLFDLPAGKELHALRVPADHFVVRLVFLPGGFHLAGVCMGQVVIWDLKSGKRIRTYQVPRDTVPVFAVSGDGKRIATAGDERTVTLWEEGSEEEASQITIGKDGISSLAFSPDGKTLLVGCGDYRVRLYDLTTNKEIKLLEKLRKPASRADDLRVVRAIEVLEQIGTEKARRLLEDLAGGAPGAKLTDGAKTALKRLPSRQLRE